MTNREKVIQTLKVFAIGVDGCADEDYLEFRESVDQATDQIHQLYTKKFMEAMGEDKNLFETTETGYWKGLGYNQHRQESIERWEGK